MTTKTFKIGLSATDKTNMAQSVYEQVEAMLFDEYDSSETYNTGDYVVYSNALYRCKEDNVTGTWNSAKWESATLQDLVDDVNGAVASVSGKADIVALENGTLVPAKSLVAEQLENVSEDSGTRQDAPFLFQATATNGGAGASDTAPTAKYLKLMGKTYAFNQILKPSAISGSSGGITFTNNANGTFTMGSGTTTGVAYFQLYLSTDKVQPIVGHTYLLKTNATGITGVAGFTIGAYGNYIESGKNWLIFTVANTNNTDTGVVSIASGVEVSSQTFSVQVIDLTQLVNGDTDYLNLFVNGVELSDYNLTFTGVDIFNQLFQLPYYAYNEGTLVSANATKLTTYGKNQFDGVLEVHSGDNYQLDGKNPIEVIPSQVYLFDTHNFSNYTGRYVNEYDGNGNLIKTNTFYKATYPADTPVQVQVTSNTHSVKIFFYNSAVYSSIHENTQIQFFVAWLENGTTSRPDYEEYVKHEYQLGDELEDNPLLSAGDVCDEKTPDGTITRRVGVVDLGTLDYVAQGNGRFVSSGLVSTIKPVSDIANIGNISCSKYLRVSYYNISTDMSICVHTSGNIYIQDNSKSSLSATDFKSAMSGVYAYYELATYETSQGTPFPAVVEVDDFGTMEYGGTNFNGYPQGCEFFYPADYVLFIDSLGNAADFDASNVVMKEYLNTAFATYLASLTGYDASKTQTLKNVEGTLTWVDD